MDTSDFKICVSIHYLEKQRDYWNKCAKKLEEEYNNYTRANAEKEYASGIDYALTHLKHKFKEAWSEYELEYKPYR